MRELLEYLQKLVAKHPAMIGIPPLDFGKYASSSKNGGAGRRTSHNVLTERKVKSLTLQSSNTCGRRIYFVNLRQSIL